MSLINIIFAIINILGVYTVYKLMGLFCGVEMIKSKKALIVIYFVYYLLSCMNFMYINILASINLVRYSFNLVNNYLSFGFLLGFLDLAGSRCRLYRLCICCKGKSDSKDGLGNHHVLDL